MRATPAPRLDSPAKSPCPGRDEMWRAIHGESPHEQARQLVNHCGQCSSCGDQWKELCEAGIEASENGADPGPVPKLPELRTRAAENPASPVRQTSANGAFASWRTQPDSSSSGRALWLWLAAALLLSIALAAIV